MSGRFDLPGPDGTCYVALDVETAVREHLRDLVVDTGLVSADRADQFEVHPVRSRFAGPFAAVTDRTAVQHRIVRELCTMTDDDYAVPQLWAAAFRAAGYDGIAYASRFTTVLEQNAWACFDTAGLHDAAPYEVDAAITGRSACGSAEIGVLPIPGSTQGLTVLH